MAKTKAVTTAKKTKDGEAAKKAAKRSAKVVVRKSSGKGVEKKQRARKSDEPKEKKKRRFRPEVVTVRAIKRLTGGKDALKMCTQRAPMERAFRDQVAVEVSGGLRMQADAIDALREAVETVAVRVFEKSAEVNGVAKRVTMQVPAFEVGVKAVLGEHFYDLAQPGKPRATPSLGAVARDLAASTPKKKAVKKPASKKPQPEEESSSSDTTGADTRDDATMSVDGGAVPPLMDVEEGADGP